MNQFQDSNQFNMQNNSQSFEQQSTIDYMKSLGIFQSIQDICILPQDIHDQFERNKNIIKSRLQSDYPFTDQQFPPDQNSLSYDKNDLKFKNVTFKRLENIYTTQQEYLMMKNIKSIDFRKSRIINDIYYISALNILEQKLTPIIRVFEIFELNKTGIYACWINIQGQWKLIIIDDNFPCIDNQYQLSTCSAGLWILILQKALAKAYGTYNTIHGGEVNLCLTDLTGCPSEIKDSEEVDQWWETLKKWQDRQFLIYTGTEMINNTKEILKQGYSYSIIDMQEVKQEQKTIQLLQLKAPSKSVIYQGDWAFSSSNWTQDLREQFGIEQQKLTHTDGIFWISLEELKKNFQTIGCCKIHESYKYKWFDILPNKNQFVVNMKIEETTHIYITLHQKDERIIKNQLYDFSPVRILISQIIETQQGQEIQQYKFIAGVYDFNREVVLEEYLYPGQYIFTVEVQEQIINNKQGKNILQDINHVLSFYGQNLPEQVDITYSANILDLQKKMLKSMAIFNPQITQKVRSYESQGQGKIKIYNDMIFGLVYFYYVNQDTKKLREQVTMTSLENIIIQEPYKDSKQFVVTLSPNSDAIVIYKYGKGDNFSFNSEIKASLDDVPGQQIQEIQERPSIRKNNLSQSRYKLKNNNIGNVQDTQTLQEMQKKTQFTNIDMLRFLRENGSMVKRIWNDLEINVYVYYCQHIEGGVIMFLNYSDHTYEEVMVFETENLTIQTINDAKLEDNAVRFILNPYEHTFVYLTAINKKDPFGFKSRTYYKYYIE